MSPESKENLLDILNRAEEIQRFTKGYTFSDYQNDSKTRLAVERLLEIIGEALNRVKKSDPTTLDLIEDYRSIISFRNILAHAYDHIEDKIVWGIIESDLPKLIRDIQKIS